LRSGRTPKSDRLLEIVKDGLKVCEDFVRWSTIMSLQRKGTADRVVSLHCQITGDVSDLGSTVPWTS
jgi:hypothetical protein